MVYRTWCCVIRVHNPTLPGCRVYNVCNMTQPECCHKQAVYDQPYTYMIHVTRLARCVMSICKVTVEIQDGWRKDAERIRNVDFRLERAYYFITHFS